MNEYYAEREKEIRQEWYGHHVGVFTGVVEQSAPGVITEGLGEAMLVLNWRNPGNSNYAMRYVLYRHYLIVTGDIGFAVYNWSQPLTWQFIAECSLDYFAGKCCASEKGSRFKDWDLGVARRKLDELFRQPGLQKAKGIFRKECGADALSNPQEWSQWLYHHWRLEELGIQEVETLSAMCEVGWVIASRCQGHLIGIQMAVAAQPVEQERTEVTEKGVPNG